MPSMFYTGLSCVRFDWSVGGGTLNDSDPKSLVGSFDGGPLWGEGRLRVENASKARVL